MFERVAWKCERVINISQSLREMEILDGADGGVLGLASSFEDMLKQDDVFELNAKRQKGDLA